MSFVCLCVFMVARFPLVLSSFSLLCVPTRVTGDRLCVSRFWFETISKEIMVSTTSQKRNSERPHHDHKQPASLMTKRLYLYTRDVPEKKFRSSISSSTLESCEDLWNTRIALSGLIICFGVRRRSKLILNAHERLHEY